MPNNITLWEDLNHFYGNRLIMGGFNPFYGNGLVVGGRGFNPFFMGTD